MSTPVPIAVIGMGCRLPGGASSPERLWEMLSEGRSGWGEVPSDRWNWKSFYHPHREAKESLNSKSGYFLDQDIGAFDAKFFNIASYEAHAMDPQQRILLETTYEALENAGMPLESIKGSNTSVYVGIYARDYDRMGFKDLPQITKLHITGTGEAVVSNRISYLLDLKGASLTIDTGCSGSMVALHQACQSLRTGETNMAIVGGTQLLLHPDQAVAMSMVGMVNPNGRCYVFDSRGSGYARGEGVGTVILKRLDDAIAAGDPIHAVIRNSGLNQDGKTAGISLPNPDAQAALMKLVYSSAGLDPRNTVYVEAHGTGTQAGDNAEVSSINRVFCEESPRESDIYVGSVKSNIGHLEASSGVAGLIKSIMILKKGMIPPNIDLEIPKPSLRLDERKIKIPVKLTPLPTPELAGPKRVSLNSFGYGGTNAHVVLEASPADHVTANGNVNGHMNGVNGTTIGTLNGPASEAVHGTTTGAEHPTKSHLPQLFVLSAASEKSLLDSAKNVQEWISTHEPGPDRLIDLAYTLNIRRSHLPLRCSVVASNAEELLSALSNVRATKVPHSISVAMVFTGQGAQWHAMGRELINIPGPFQDSISKSDRLMKSFGCEWSLLEELARDEQCSKIGQSELSQPATTAIQVALIDLLATVGVTPHSVCGHSSGEIGAAYAAGALSHEAAIEIAYRRGLCSAAAKKQNTTKGSMLAVGIGEKEVLPYVKQVTKGLITVACVNSPDSTTISGDEMAIDELKELLDAQSIFNRKLKVDTAYHSHHMKKIADQYLESLTHVTTGFPRPGTVFYSSVTAGKKTSNFGPSYWVENLVSQVRFSAALQLLAEDLARSKQSNNVANAFVEIGPHSALSGPVRQTLAKLSAGSFKYTYASALIRNKNAVQSVLDLTGQLFERGYPVQFENVLKAVNGPEHADKKTIGDLSPYPWDHSMSYWYESRLSRDHRLRPFPYHDLLGLLDVASNVHEPRWRYHLNVDALPWLRDHVIEDFMIFPGTGYLCMAVEAMKQLVELRKTPGTVSRFLLRNVVLSKPIIVPDQRPDSFTPDVEVQLTLSRVKAHDGSRWEHFRVFSYADDGSWHENCSGQVTAEMIGKTDEVEGTREDEFTAQSFAEIFHTIEAGCDFTMESHSFYEELRRTGNNFGPKFTAITDIKLGKQEGCATVRIPDIPGCMPANFLQPHVIHPTTLDAINQLAVILFKRECVNAALMPTFFREISISANMTATPADELLIAMNLHPDGPRQATGNSYAYERKEDGSLSLVVEAAGLQLRAIGEAQSDTEDVPFHRKMSYRIQWQPDVDFLSNDKFHQSVVEEVTGHSQPNQILDDGGIFVPKKVPIEQDMAIHERAATIYMRDALSQTTTHNNEVEVAPHLIALRDWMKSHVDSGMSKETLQGLAMHEEAEIVQKSLQSGVEGLMLSRVGFSLPQILTGQVKDTLAFLQEYGLFSKFLMEGILARSYQHMVEYVKSLVFKHPHMKILEVGASIGEAAIPILRAIDRPEGLLANRYVYTGVNDSHLEHAKSSLGAWANFTDFQTLDLDQDPVDQGFSTESYDLVVAANVLHEAKNMGTTMAHIRKLLKPGGKLVLVELTRLTAALGVIFGTLPGWWTAEDARKDGPLLSESQWNELLVNHSFNGIEIVSNEYDGPKPRSSMIVSTAVDAATPTAAAQVQILTSTSQSASVGKLADALSAAFQSSGISCSSGSWDPAFEHATTYVVIDDMENPLLLNPSAELFESLKSFYLTTKTVLWISTQSITTPNTAAAKGLITGMARVVRRENEGLQFITLDIQEDVSEDVSDTCVADLSDTVTRIANACFWPSSEAQRSKEYEFALVDGQVCVPRVQPDTRFNTWIDRMVGSGQLETRPYQQPDRPLKLHVETPGLLSSLRFVDDATINAPLAPGELELEAKAYGVNFKDVFIALGQMLPGVNMIGEVSGVVTAVGSAMQSRFKIGDRIAGVGAQPFTSHARVKGLMACTLPESISFSVGASIPVIYLTAYHCLHQVARLRKGQNILIHAASGGVGQAAIQLAQHVGAEIFATVGSTAKRQLLMDRYNIPESHIFSTRSRTFKHGVLRLTKQKGVDVVLNSLSGEWLNESWECIAPLGIFVEIGKTDIYKRSHLNMVPFDRSVTFAAVDLVVLFETQPEQMNEEFRLLMSMFQTGVLNPVAPVTTISMSKIEDAFRLISSRKHTGKVVVEAEEGAVVKAVMSTPAPIQLDRNGSYVVAGGLGDLGKRICRVLASHGAGHIVTLSRRSIPDEVRETFEDDIRKLGGTLHIVQCDITDDAMIAEATEHFKTNLPPVKGVIHAGMVLRDHPLEQMTLDDYVTATKPKVKGTINLHSLVAGPDLDFFITLSSITAIIGKTGQANYSAGNAFQDAFAHAHSSKSHTRYISLNLGAIDGSDAITSLPIRQQELMRQGAILVKFTELFKIIEYAMGPQARQDDCVQTISGFDRKSMETVQDTFGLNNPIFSHIPYLEGGTESSSAGVSDKVDTEKAIRNAKSIAEAEDIITHAVAEKFAVFMDRSIDDVNLDQSLAAFGLDSLVSIELKNWMVRTFQVTLQTSEIADALSIVALAKTITSRSKLVSDELRGDKKQSEDSTEDAPLPVMAEDNSTSEPSESSPNHDFACCRYAKELPRQPIMDLDEALHALLEGVRHFASGDEYDNLVQAVEEFRTVGRPVYDQLAAKANDTSVESWSAENLLNHLFLKRRLPLVPFSSYLATHHDSKIPHSQAERAALIATTAMKFKKAVEADTLEPHWYFGIPSCMSSWQWLFNVHREPHHDIDTIAKYPGNDYCVALRRGHVFKLALTDDDNQVLPYDRVHSTLEAIIESVQDEGSWAGVLTSDERNSWAEVCQMLLDANIDNAEYFNVIAQAAFVICLDDGAPATNVERVRMAYLGDGFNRWNDKSLQFFIYENGASGYLVEHSKIDGLTVHRMNEWIHDAIREYVPKVHPNGTANGTNGTANGTNNHYYTLDEYTLSTTPAIDDRIQLAREHHLQRTSTKEYGYHILPHFGKEFLITHGCPIKSVFDVTIQLASRLYFGYNPASWEPMSMAHFHKGRTEIFQGVLGSVAQFCATATDENVPALERRDMLIRAANDYTAGLHSAGRGNSYFRLMDVMATAWPENEPQPALFKNPVWLRTYPDLIMSGLTDGGSLDSALGMINPESVWICYSIWENDARFSIVGPAGKVTRFEEALNDAATVVKKLVESKST